MSLVLNVTWKLIKDYITGVIDIYIFTCNQLKLTHTNILVQFYKHGWVMFLYSYQHHY